MAETKEKTEKKEKAFKLPKYLKLAKGSMWFDTEGENASGVKLYSGNTVFVGRGLSTKETDLPRDKYNNQNITEFGYIEKELPWYIDTSTIPSEKQSRIIIAYKMGILDKADPNNPPKREETTQIKDFATNKRGDRIFVGKNKDMYVKLQTLHMLDIIKFISTFPKNNDARNNLIDLYHYELKGYNKFSSARQEVLDKILEKLKEFGPSITPIRKNEDEDE